MPCRNRLTSSPGIYPYGRAFRPDGDNGQPAEGVDAPPLQGPADLSLAGLSIAVGLTPGLRRALPRCRAG
jgi:hypothetical protein